MARLVLCKLIELRKMCSSALSRDIGAITVCNSYKMLSYRRETALQGAL